MDAINLNHRDNKKNIFKIVEEYCKLIRLSSPSDIELERLEKIMELAVYDVELNNLINREDEQYAIENNLLGDDYLDEKESSIIELDNPNFLSNTNHKDSSDEARYESENRLQKSENTSNVVRFPCLVTSHPEKRKMLGFDMKLVISSFVAGGILTCFGITGLHNSFNSEKDFLLKDSITIMFFSGHGGGNFVSHNTNNYSLSNVNNTDEIPVCNSNSGKPNQRIEEYYESFKQLENQIETQELQPLKLKNEVRYLQVKAERHQRQAELNQRDAEIKKQQAQMQSRYAEAEALEAKAQTLLSESQQWLCLSRQALTLSIH
jgi:hypothetical protein